MLKVENRKILQKLEHVEESLKYLEEVENKVKMNIEKLTESVQSDAIEDLEIKIQSQNDKIKSLQNHIDNLETENVKKNTIIEKLLEKFEKLEETQSNLIEDARGKYKCNKCDFETYHKTGLKIHKKKKHQSKSCDKCDDIFDTARDLKIHAYTHSYTSTGNWFDPKQTCKMCDFVCETPESMEVHLGKCRTEDFECGLCESKFSELTNLETHLKTCEIYECGKCFIRYRLLSEMKKHITDNHESSTRILYTKMDRNNENEVCIKKYSLSDV